MARTGGYIAVPIITDQNDLAQEALDEFRLRIPAWLPAEGAAEVVTIESTARLASILRDLESQITTQVFRFFGASVAVLLPYDPAPAIGSSTWHLKDDFGHTIPAGTQVAVRRTADELIGFQVASEVTVPPGSTETAVGEVTIVAIDGGVNGNNLTADPLLVSPTFDWVDSITLVGATTNGADGETDDEYLTRLRGKIRLLTDTPITAPDYATLIVSVFPEVDRCLALDLYNPDDNTWDNPRFVTCAPADVEGQPLNSSKKLEIDAFIQSKRETDFDFRLIDPTYTEVDVAVRVHAYPNFDKPSVRAAVEAKLAEYFDPSNWGLPKTLTAETIGTGWEPGRDVVRHHELDALIDGVDGVDWVDESPETMLGSGPSKSYTVAAATDVFTSTTHGYSNGDAVVLKAPTGGAPVVAKTVYYVRDVAANTFKLALTSGGAAINITADGSGSARKVTTADVTLAGPAPLTTPGQFAVTVL